MHASVLHYRWLGVKYVTERYSVYKERLSEYNRLNNYCDEYNRNEDDVEDVYESLKSMAVQVI